MSLRTCPSLQIRSGDKERRKLALVLTAEAARLMDDDRAVARRDRVELQPVAA